VFLGLRDAKARNALLVDFKPIKGSQIEQGVIVPGTGVQPRRIALVTVVVGSVARQLGKLQRGNLQLQPRHPLVGQDCTHPSGVIPRTISNLAATSPIRDPLIGLKSTRSALRALASRRPRKTPSFMFCAKPLM